MSDTPWLYDEEKDEPEPYQVFRNYYLPLGPTRTLIGAYRAYIAIERPDLLPEPDEDRDISVTPKLWSEWCEKYEWRERALAYDQKLFADGGVLQLAREKLQMATMKAADALVEALGNPRLAVQAAKEILDRGGLPATTAHLIKGMTMSADDLAAAEEELREWRENLSNT